jgi:hypothetical protein
MSKIRINFNKNVKMHIVAKNSGSMRSVLEYIYFNNGFMYATNSHVLVKNKISECSDFSEEQIAILNDKYIHKDDYKKLLNEDIIIIEQDGFLVRCAGGRKTKYYFSTDCGKFPNANVLFTKKIGEPVVKIGINPTLLLKLSQALHYENKLALFFNTENHGIIVRDIELSNESVGLIMPVLITNDI